MEVCNFIKKQLFNNKGKEDKNPLPQPSTSAQNVRDETINFIQSEASQSTSAQKVGKPDEAETLTQAKENPPLEPKVTATKNVHADEPGWYIFHQFLFHFFDF